MQNVSEAFIEAMEYRPYIARITLDGVETIQGDPIKEIRFSGGTNDDSSRISIGSTVAATVELSLDKKRVAVPIKGRKLTVELGIAMGAAIEWLLMGTYEATNVIQDDDSLTVTAMDTMAAKLDVEYEALPGLNFSDDGGVSSTQFLSALCARRGVSVDLSGLQSIQLKDFDPVGCTERKIIGMIAALYGRFAAFGRSGVLQFRWYTPVNAKVTGDNYYENGMEIAQYDFVPQWLKCYNETREETLTLGDPEAEQGIYFECPWMLEERLEAIWSQVRAFSFRPVTELSFLGDPRLDPGDIITLEDCGGGVYSVPVMFITHEWDGGIVTEVTAQGQAKTDVYEGPVQREFKRTTAQIIKRQKELELSIKSFNGKEIISRINLSEEQILIQANKIKFEGLVTANKNFQILTDGSMRAVNADISGKITTQSGSIAGWNIDNNSVRYGDLGAAESMWLCRTGTTKSPSTYKQEGIAGTDASKSGWCIAISNKFGVDKEGQLFAVGANIVGKVITQEGSIAGWDIDDKSIHYGQLGAAGSMWLCRTGTTVSPSTYMQEGIAGTDASKSGWCIAISNAFGVDRDGLLFAEGARISGEIMAISGSISRFNIDKTGITGIAYVKGSTTATHINVGFCPGSIGTGNYYERTDNRDVISLFIGVERITEPSELNGNGTVFANFMVNQYGDLFATNAEFSNAKFSNATAEEITAEDILLKYEQANMTVVINLRTEIESLRRRITALGG